MVRDHTSAGRGSAILSGVDDENDTFTIHGVAIGSGDITVGSSGVRKIWPEEALREASKTLEGKPLVKDHENSVDGVIGRVTETKFKEGTGVLYEAEITEQFDDVAQKIADGLLEVSVRAYHAPTEELEEDEELDAKIVSDVVFDNLAVVPQGAAPSNTAQAGSAAAMEQSVPQLSAAELRAEFGYEELAYHGPVLDMIDEFTSMEDFSDETPISRFLGWADDEEAESAVDDFVDDHEDVSRESPVSRLRSWIEEDMDDDENSDSAIDADEDELSLHVIKVFGHVGLNEEFLNQNSVDGLLDDLESHDAVNAVLGDDDHNLALVIDGSIVDSNEELDEHVRETLDETPWEVFDEWSWLDHVDERLESHDEDVVEELAMVNGLEINGTVMWGEDRMGVISGFEEDGDSLVVQIDVMEKTDDGPFEKTGETVTRPIHSVGMEENVRTIEQTEHTPLLQWTVAELQDISVHEPEWSGTTTGDWSKPALEDFTDGSWEDLSGDEKSSIAGHFLVSKSGFPGDTFGDLALPVVEPSGELNLSALQNAKARSGQVSGLGGDALDRVDSTINRLANENFEDASFDDEEENEDTESDSVPLDDYLTAQINYDSPSADKSETSGQGTTANTTDMNIEYQSVDGDELDDGYVAVDRDELDSVVEKAQRADDLDDRLDEMNSTLETLSEKTEILDDVDEDDLEELRSFEDPVIKEREAYDTQMDAVDEVGGVFAELLAEQDSIFTAEELKERHSPLELKAKFEDQLEEDETIVDQLRAEDPDPKGEDPEEEELGSDGGSDDGPDREAAREALARSFEEKGYTTQAEEMRQGRIPVEEYEDQLGVSFE